MLILIRKHRFYVNGFNKRFQINKELTVSQAASPLPSGENLRLRLRGNYLKKTTKFDKIAFIIEKYY